MPKQKLFFNTFKVKAASETVPSRTDCNTCGLWKDCKSPVTLPSGNGSNNILVVAQSMGEDEDEQGTQLVGKAGQFLRRTFLEFGIDLDKDCRKTNAINCKPNGNITATQIKCCRPITWNEIKNNKPHLVFLFGSEAVESVIGHRWKQDDRYGISRWRGWVIPDQQLNAWIAPVFHPSFILRKGEEESVEYVIFKQDIEKAVQYLNKKVPQWGNEQEKGEITFDIDYAIDVIKSMDDSDFVAFDYETTGLKPHRQGHRIVSCAMSNDKNYAIAFPCNSDKINSFMKEWLQNDIPKIAANKKYEEIWGRQMFGVRTNNWLHDVMIDSHILDNRKGITSVKFQSYINYGLIDYDSHISSYLKFDGREEKEHGANGFNNVSKADPEELLTYNKMDAMLEYRLAKDQINARKDMVS